MEEKIRIVRKSGNSLSLTIPKECGLLLGDYVKIGKEDNKIIVVKMVLQ